MSWAIAWAATAVTRNKSAIASQRRSTVDIVSPFGVFQRVLKNTVVTLAVEILPRVDTRAAIATSCPSVLSRKFGVKTHVVILSEAKDLCILSAPRALFRPSRRQPPTLFVYSGTPH